MADNPLFTSLLEKAQTSDALFISECQKIGNRINIRKNDNYSPYLVEVMLQTVSDERLPALLKVMIDHGLDLTIGTGGRYGIKNEGILCAAVKAKKIQALRFLINHGCAVNDPDDLVLAMIPSELAKENKLNLIRELIEIYGADINAQDLYGCTPLIHAIKFGHWDIFEFLLENYRSNLFLAQTTAGRLTAFYWVSYGANSKYLEMLTKHACRYVYELGYDSVLNKKNELIQNFAGSYTNQLAGGVPLSDLKKYIEKHVVRPAFERLEKEREMRYIFCLMSKNNEKPKRKNAFFDNEIFDRNLLRNIFSYAQESTREQKDNATNLYFRCLRA